MKENILNEWVEGSRTALSELGFEFEKVTDSEFSNCSTVDLNGPETFGRICHWPPDVFEFQFHDLKTGDVMILETKNFNNDSELGDFVSSLLSGAR